jgi:hypothetical protein
MFKRKSITDLKAFEEGGDQYKLLVNCGLPLFVNNKYKKNTSENKEFHRGFEIEKAIQDPFNDED